MSNQPENPVLFFSPAVLQATARRFIDGFPGLVTYAVKSNPEEVVVENLSAAGVRGFDVRLALRDAADPSPLPRCGDALQQPGALARRKLPWRWMLGVKSYSVNSASELAKLIELVPAEGTEITVRFKLPVSGAAYNFGAKFGATVELATELLNTVAAAGFIPSLTFHPGTQCTDPHAWEAYIRAAAEIARRRGRDRSRD